MSKPCKRCFFYNSYFPCCDYLDITGEIRGCPAEDCTAFLTPQEATERGLKKTKDYNKRTPLLTEEERRKLNAYLKEAHEKERAKLRYLNF